MSSIAQLVSEMAHSVRQPDSVPVRRALKLGIIHARNQLVRHSQENHGYVDKGLQQRFKVSLIDVPDGDIYGSSGVIKATVKRTKNKVPRPVRLANNLPFLSVRTIGMSNPIEIAFAKEASAKFYDSLPGFCPSITYDYINDYIYIRQGGNFRVLNTIVIESPFEYPHIIPVETSDKEFDITKVDDNNEFFLPEDMVNDAKKLVMETFNINPIIVRDTNEITSMQKVL